MIKKRLIAGAHLPHKIARLKIAHAVPRLALPGARTQIIEGKIARLGL